LNAKGEGVAKDEAIEISLPKKKQRHKCRRIEYIGIVKDRIGKESHKRFVFLSNNFKLSAKTIAGILAGIKM
jgi:hypothetical protein